MSILNRLTSLLGLGGKTNPAPTEPSSASSRAEVMRGLRTNLLTTPAAQFGVSPSAEFPRVYAVLMDWPLGEHTATVVSLCDGSASLYTTGGFGVIGGHAHDSVRAAAIQFVRSAEKHHDAASAATDHPYPSAGRVSFYLVCFEGVRVIESRLNDLTSGQDPCFDLWGDGQRVLTELRVMTEKSG